jgi:release factor glutamine methyltransferase
VPSPRLDAEVLLAWVLGLDRVGLYVHFDRPLEPAEVDKYRQLVRRRAKRVPVAHLRGFKEFFALPFTVSPAVLIPRPETELLVQEVLSWLAAQGAAVTLPTGRSLAPGERQSAEPEREWLVADVGTGSGCIPVTLAHCAPAVKAVASDLSPAALAVAAENCARHGVTDRVELREGDGPAAFFSGGLAGRFDVVVSNPPYIPSKVCDELEPDLKFEPRGALDGGPDGLRFYREWLPELGRLLKPGGLLALEIGHDQGPAVSELVRTTGVFTDLAVHADYSGRDRVVRASRVAAR